MRSHLVSLEHPGLHLLEVGVRIKTWRLRRRITQQELAALANISCVALSSLKNGGAGGFWCPCPRCEHLAERRLGGS
jgi:hypothetical protein